MEAIIHWECTYPPAGAGLQERGGHNDHGHIRSTKPCHERHDTKPTRLERWRTAQFLYIQQSLGNGTHPATARGKKTRHHTRRLEIRPLSECDKQNIIQASNAEHVPTWAQLNTINLREAIHDLSSVLFQNDRIIGWLITFPLLDKTLDYRILWIDSTHRKTGLAITALSEIIRKAHFQDNLEDTTTTNDHGNPWPRGFFIMHSKNQAMINFVSRRLAQSLNQQSELICREKQINHRKGKQEDT